MSEVYFLKRVEIVLESSKISSWNEGSNLFEMIKIYFLNHVKSVFKND